MPLISATSRARAFGRGGSLQKIMATGGTITTSGSYTLHTFTTVGSSTFSVTSAPTNAVVEVLAIGGGGAGGWDVGGGGGAGGVVYNPAYSVTSGASYSVTVGQGGQGGPSGQAGFSGANSTFGTGTVMTALGGGGAGAWSGIAPRTGGGSGGGTTSNTGGFGSANQTNSGGGIGFGWNSGTGFNNSSNVNDYAGGSGGGGAGGKGGDGAGTSYGTGSTTTGAGGHGLAFNITGTETFYAGGGGTIGDIESWWAYGGAGGGGDYTTVPRGDATYYGSGGAGAGQTTMGRGSNIGGYGYQGIVIVRYPTNPASSGLVNPAQPYTIRTSGCQAWFDASQFTAGASTWTDRINGYTMTANTTNTSKSEGSYRITPTSGSINFVGSNITALNVGTGGIAYECWIYLNTTNFSSWRYIIGKSTFWDANSSGIYINNDGTRLGFHTTSTNGVEVALTSVGTGWKHIVGVRNPTTGRQLWVNGSLLASDRTIDSISTSSAICFGSDQNRGYSETTYKLGSCRFYSAALTADDVIRNYMLEKANYGL